MELPTGARDLPIAGIIAASGLVRADIVVPLAVLEAGGVPPVDNILYVNRAAGADPAAVTAGIDAVLADLPTVTLKDQAAYTAEESSLYDPVLGIVYALLGLAIVIAVLGIVNTLALSVIERTREVGLLRAVGMSRRQLRSMIRLESVAIAVLGAVLGIGLGLAFGISLQHALAGQGIPVLSIPGVAARRVRRCSPPWPGCSPPSSRPAGPRGWTSCGPSPPSKPGVTRTAANERPITTALSWR